MKKVSCRRHTDLFYKFLNAVETASVWRGHSAGKKRQEHCGWREGGGEGRPEEGGVAPRAGRKQRGLAPCCCAVARGSGVGELR